MDASIVYTLERQKELQHVFEKYLHTLIRISVAALLRLSSDCYKPFQEVIPR